MKIWDRQGPVACSKQKLLSPAQERARAQAEATSRRLEKEEVSQNGKSLFQTKHKIATGTTPSR